MQFSAGHRATGADPLAPLLVLAATALFGALLIIGLERFVVPAQRRMAARRARSLRVPVMVRAELRTRAMMDELCPEGWGAEIVLYSSGEDLPYDAPHPEVDRVALDWTDFREPDVVRRVWAESIDRALEAMVAERIADETLRDIEARALEEGAAWPD